MKLVEGNIVIQVKNAKRPKFGGRGRTWDSLVNNINGRKTELFYDSTWGYNFYFQVNHKWYSIPVFDNYDIMNTRHNFHLVRGNVNIKED